MKSGEVFVEGLTGGTDQINRPWAPDHVTAAAVPMVTPEPADGQPGGVALTWVPNPRGGSPGRYLVERKGPGDADFREVASLLAVGWGPPAADGTAPSIDVTTWTDHSALPVVTEASLGPGTYVYRLVAASPVGRSNPSDTVTVIIGGTPGASGGGGPNVGGLAGHSTGALVAGGVAVVVVGVALAYGIRRFRQSRSTHAAHRRVRR